MSSKISFSDSGNKYGMCIIFVFAEAQVSFTQTRFSITEGKEQYVEVCITLKDAPSLDLSLGAANFTITTLDSMTTNSG